ncbi:hypothetical protein ACIQMJ_24625 [Actinosynnema sp. NPDC091369]
MREHHKKPVKKNRPGGRHTPNLPGLLVAALATLLAFALAAALLLFGIAWLSGVKLFPPASGLISGAQLHDLVKTTVSAATLVAGAFALVYAYRKQRIDEATSHRADAEHLSKRYQDAAAQLGHDRAPVRLAGVYAIGRLADDWPENRQMCVDLLCAYLRMPYRPSLENDDESLVRKTIFDVIRQHLTDPADPDSWCDLDFDFSGGTYDKVNLYGSHFKKEVDFSDAKFTGLERRSDDRNDGWFHFERCYFGAGASFFQTRFEGAVLFFDEAEFASGITHFGGASFTNFNLFFRKSEFSGGTTYFGHTEFTQASNCPPVGNLGHATFDESRITGGKVVFRGAELNEFVRMSFADVELTSGELDLSGLALGEPIGDSELPSVLVTFSTLADGRLTTPETPDERFEVTYPDQPPA